MKLSDVIGLLLGLAVVLTIIAAITDASLPREQEINHDRWF